VAQGRRNGIQSYLQDRITAAPGNALQAPPIWCDVVVARLAAFDGLTTQDTTHADPRAAGTPVGALDAYQRLVRAGSPLLALRSGGSAAKSSMLDLDDPVHGIKCSLQIDRSGVKFAFQLLQQPFELVLCGIDLLLYQARPFLQLSTDITHRLSPR